jgi:hypothetical protein
MAIITFDRHGRGIFGAVLDSLPYIGERFGLGHFNPRFKCRGRAAASSKSRRPIFRVFFSKAWSTWMASTNVAM